MTSPPSANHDSHLNHISLSQKLLSVPSITRSEDKTPSLLNSLAQESPHSSHKHFFPTASSSPSSGAAASASTSKKRKLKSLSDAPVFCYLCGKKVPLRIIHQHHDKCLADLLDFNPNALVPKPPETPIPEFRDSKFLDHDSVSVLSSSPPTRGSMFPQRSRSSSFRSQHRSSNSSLLSNVSSKTANTTNSTLSSGASSSSSTSSSTTTLTKMALRLYNAEAREIYFTKRPREPDVEKKFMTPEMRLLMNETLNGSMSSSGNDAYEETWTMHATSSLRRNSPANKKHMLQNSHGYRIGSGYGVDIYPPETLLRAPLPIYGHSGAYCDRGILLSFGGYEKKSQMHPNQVSNKLWMFQADTIDPPSRKRTNKMLNSGKWREIHPLNHSKEMIPPRAYHTSVFIGNRLYVYGGESLNGKILGDFWCFDMDFKQWVKVPVAWLDQNQESSSSGLPNRLDRTFSATSITSFSSSLSSPISGGGSPLARHVNNGLSSPLTRERSSSSSSLPVKNKTAPSSAEQSTEDPGVTHRYPSGNLKRGTIESDVNESQIPPCLKHHTAIVSFHQKFSQKDIPAMPIKRRKLIKKQYKRTKDPFYIQNLPDSPNVNAKSRKMIIYGGINEDGEVCSDVWEFSFYTRRWFGTRGPPGRYGHSCVYYAENDKMVIFGGRDAEGNFLDDVWIYDCSNSVFEKINVNHSNRERTPLAKNHSPSPRAFHSCVIDRNLMFIVGGYNNDQKKACDDIWVLDLYDYQWTKLSYSRSFTPRIHAQLTRVNEDQFIMTGGMSLPKETPQRNSQLLHFPDPEDEENIDEELVVLAGSTIGTSDEFMEKQIRDIVSDMLLDTDEEGI